MVDPFEEMDRMFQGMAPIARGFTPAIDIYQDETKVYVETPLPGVDMDDVNIMVENDVLTIECRSEKHTEVDEKNYYRKEVRAGSFHRAVQLPAAVVGEEAEAEYADGVLKISIPKKEDVKPKSIKVNIKK